MTRRTMERTLWTATAVAALLAAAGWRGAVPAARSTPLPVWRGRALPRFALPDSLAAAARSVVARDPFRLERRPASVAYGPETENAASVPQPPRPPRPALAVGGIVGGPGGAWAALLEGVPGREGSVLVRRGDRLGDLLVRAVGRDSVIVSAPDTTWRLAVRRKWR